MTRPHLHGTTLMALDLLALARRGAAHDVNNLLAVIQGNMQLLRSLDGDAERSELSEIALACDRLALLCDSWLLADSAMPPPNRIASVKDALSGVVRLVERTQDAELRVLTDPAAWRPSCGVDDRTLRALLYCTLMALLQSARGPALDIHLHARDTACTVQLNMVCRPDHQPRVVAPGSFDGTVAGSAESITTGLWDVAQCLGRRGGELRHASHGDAFHLWLDLPPPPF